MDFMLGCGLLILMHVLWTWELQGREFSEARGSGEIIVCGQSFIIFKVMSLPILYLFSVQIKSYLLMVAYEHRGIGSSPSLRHRPYTIATSMPQVLQTGTCFNSFFFHLNFSTQGKKKKLRPET